ncbi:hypothetical protein TNCV_1722121 [Trichonephila clavipes]|nr:hypothetical protein TNCV_1722121 [Trichonephila clavipes]
MDTVLACSGLHMVRISSALSLVLEIRDDRWRNHRSPPPQFRHGAEREGNILQYPALVIQPTRLSDPLIQRARTPGVLGGYLVASGIEPRPSGLESDALGPMTRCKALIHYHECKLLSGIDVSEKAGKVSKMTNALDVRRLSALLKTWKNFYGGTVCHHIILRMLNENHSADEVKRASQAELKDTAKNGSQKCFEDLYKPW